MRNPNLDYKAGLTDLWSVFGDGEQHLGECDAKLKEYLEVVRDELSFKPSRSVMRFTENDVVGIGETQ